MKLRGIVTLALVAMGGAAAGTARADVVINELMYHPPSTNVLEEWIELANRGAAPANVSGWRFTDGITFTVPPGTTIPGGGYLVVAADAATFGTQHPGVTNFVGGWQRTLGDDGDRLRLEDATGVEQCVLSYGPQGDWATLRLAPADRYGKRDWEWHAEHDGGGKSAELVNAALPVDNGFNWASSTVDGGTPGRPNSTAAAEVAPLFSELAHFPPVPRSTDPIRFTVRVIDERRETVTVALHHRIDSVSEFTETPLLDDGAHGDGLPGDGVYGTTLPAQPAGTLLEFRLTASDAGGRTRTYPTVEAEVAGRSANLVLLVTDEPPVGEQPRYRLVMTKAEYDYLKGVWADAPDSDAGANGTLIATGGTLEGGTTTEVRYLAHFRNRGHGSRTSVPHNVRVDVPKDKPWQGRTGINLNTQYTQAQLLGSDLMRRAGLPMAESRTVEVRINGENLAGAGAPQFGAYVANESPNGTFVKRQFPNDPSGWLFRGIRDVVPGAKADLAWHGSAPTAYTNAYFPQNNVNSPNWSGLIRLLGALNNAPDGDYVQRVNEAADARQWMRYFAMNALLDNQETALATGYGDDYALFFGETDTRARLLPYDMDSIMGKGTRTTTYADGLFRMTGSGANAIPALQRFMTHPAFAPLYYSELVELADTLFEPAVMDPLIDRLHAALPPGAALDGALASMKAFNVSHLAYVRGLIPRSLVVSNTLALQNGFPHTTTANIELRGVADAVATRQVFVNGAPAIWTAWNATWSSLGLTLHPGLNRVVIRSVDSAGVERDRLVHEVWFDDGSTVAVAGGNLSVDTTWTAANGPYQVNASLTVGAGATLTIEPGTSVYLAAGANLTIASGGRLLAEGTENAPIHITRAPEATTRWGGIVVNGTVGSPETRIVHAHIAFNSTTAIHSTGGTVFLDHLTFGSADQQYISLDGSSFIVSHCVFPDAAAGFELCHGTGGIKAGGHGLFLRNFFGRTQGYNDVIDFTGGNRPAPVVHFIGNVFTGASDDMLDLDGTDAWAEDNIFLHAHRAGSPDSSSAISGGIDGTRTSHVTAIGNLFYDVDQAATAKQGNFYILLHNTIVRQNHEGSQDPFTAVLNFADGGTTEGLGMYLDGNILYDLEALTRNFAAAALTLTNNLLPLPWTGAGGGNSSADPLFAHVPAASETTFASWDAAQVFRQWLALRPGSPGLVAGLGRTLGGAGGATLILDGVPQGTNAATSATINVGPFQSGGTIPATGWPSGAGYVRYRWRLDGGAWSAETPISQTIALSGLLPGAHRLEVSGQRDTGLYQDDPLLADAASLTAAEWVTDPNYLPPTASSLQLSEILARNVATLTSGELTPDFVELQNVGDTPFDLAGVGVTDDPDRPYRFQFPAGTTLPPGGRIILLGDSDVASPGYHLGFAFKQEGDSVSLYAKAASGGALLDTIEFGSQVTDRSIGRVQGGVWTLCRPTPGEANEAVPTGDTSALRINEWLASSLFLFGDDFVELYNPGTNAVALEGLCLSDAAGALDRHRFGPLSFIGAGGYLALQADGKSDSGHLDFQLSREAGLIRLSGPDLSLIDAVTYPPQRTDVSQGRSPDGSDTLVSFPNPTPGGPNPGVSEGNETVTHTSQPIFGFEHSWRYRADAVNQQTAWKEVGFNDTAWSAGTALFGTEASTPYPYPLPIKTPVPIRTAGNVYVKTAYFRTHFTLTNATGFQLWSTNYLDDGAVYYLNGTRVRAVRVADNPATYTSDATSQADEGAVEVLELPTANLVVGDNVLAVEVHQAGGSSTDIVFGMALAAVTSQTNHASGGLMPIVLNEVLAVPAGNSPTASPWIELHNPSTNAIPIGGLSLSDDPGFPTKWQIPAGITIAPGGFWMVASDARRLASATNTGFGLPPNGGSVYLFHRPTDSGAALDSLAFGLQTAGLAVGRVPDGMGSWGATAPSPAAANASAVLGSPASLRLNEWLADPISGSDWFEVFNTDSLPVSFDGLAFTDDLARPLRSPVRPLSFIGARAFVQIFADGSPAAGANHAGFKLSKNGSDLGIFAANGTPLDQLHFNTQATGVSQGRLPDGSETIAVLSGGPSPAAPNFAGPSDRDADGLPDAWELANGTNPDLADAGLDPDHDGQTNLDEYLSGTNPQDQNSALRLVVTVSPDAGPTLTFERVAGRAYLLQSRDALGEGLWVDRVEFPASNQTQAGNWSDPLAPTTRFYRVLSTWSP